MSLFSCKNQQQEINKAKALEYNKTAEAYMLDLHSQDSALYYFDKAIALDGDNYLFHSRKAAVYQQNGEFKKAISELELAISKNDDLAETWISVGLLYDLLNDLDLANRSYKKGIKGLTNKINDPNHKKTIYSNRTNRAVAYILIGEDEQGKTELKKLLEENPKDIFIQAYLSWTKEDFLNRMTNDNLSNLD